MLLFQKKSGGLPLSSDTKSYHDLADDIAAVLKAEKISQPVKLIGHAFGNRIARTFAADYPQQVSQIALLSAGGEKPTPKKTSKSIAMSVFGFWSEAQRKQAIADAFFAKGNDVPAYWLKGWYPLAGISQSKLTANTTDTAWMTAGLAQVLILQASEDKAAPPDDAGIPLARRLSKRAEFREIAGAGHAMLPEQPDVIAKEIIRFFKRELPQEATSL